MRPERDQQFCVKTEEGYVFHWAADSPEERKPDLGYPVTALCGQTIGEKFCHDPHEVGAGNPKATLILCNGCWRETLREQP